MGTSGVAVFDSDTADDVRREYAELREGGLVPAFAARLLASQWKDRLEDSDERIDFWLALAQCQVDEGGVAPKVAKMALKLIDSGEAAGQWSGATAEVKSARHRVLEELRSRLLNPPAALPRPKRPRNAARNAKPGEIYAVQLESGDWGYVRMYSVGARIGILPKRTVTLLASQEVKALVHEAPPIAFALWCQGPEDMVVVRRVAVVPMSDFINYTEVARLIESTVPPDGGPVHH